LLRAGLAEDIRTKLDEGGPYAEARGGGCSYSFDRRDGRVVAYRIESPERACSVRWQGSRDRYVCGADPIAPQDIGQWPIWTAIEAGSEVLLVDLRSQPRCDAYVLDQPDALAARLAEGPVHVRVPPCGAADFWLLADARGEPATLADSGPSCTVVRSGDGRLRCGADPATPRALPGPPLATISLAETTSGAGQPAGTVVVADLG